MCSIDRFAFEQRLGGFVDHVTNEHNALHYLFYIDFLLKRNPTEYTGLESFVRSRLDASNYDWCVRLFLLVSISPGVTAEHSTLSQTGGRGNRSLR